MTEKIPTSSYGALILAAGKSTRMGTYKLNLPWYDTTVFGSVIRNLRDGGISRFFIVCSSNRKPVEPSNLSGVKLDWIENPKADTEEMLVSIQAGLNAIPSDVEYVFICLGDQPTINPQVIGALIDELSPERLLIIPSYRMRRGHPWVVKRDLWPEITRLDKNNTVRTFIDSCADKIHYVSFDMKRPDDMDTPDDYQKLLKETGYKKEDVS